MTQPAAMVMRLPLKVPEWWRWRGERGSKISITSARPPKAPTGRPPPMILPIVVRSGRTPKDLLEAADGEPEGYDLVADEERPVLVGQTSRRREVFWGPGKNPRPRYRLQDYRRHLVAFLLHCRLELANVVVVDHAHQLADPLGHGSPVRVRVCGREIGTCSHMPS